jgi:hypothetical protein
MSREMQEQLDALRQGLKTPLADHSLDKLFPVLVPSSFRETNTWPGPIEPLNLMELSVTWAVLGPAQTMTYVYGELAKFWEHQGINWKAQALRNVWSATKDQPCTGYLLDESGKPYFMVLMHQDGLGPSRLLLPKLYSGAFPNGYDAAVPERSCAFVFRRGLAAYQDEKIEQLIEDCFSRGTSPMSPKRFEADLLWQPFET